jgi:hypothetical protein
VTKLLEKAFKKASKLPEVEQNALAKWLLDELEAEQKWARKFAESEDILERLADEARESHRKRKTKPLDMSRLEFWNVMRSSGFASGLIQSTTSC